LVFLDAQHIEVFHALWPALNKESFSTIQVQTVPTPSTFPSLNTTQRTSSISERLRNASEVNFKRWRADNQKRFSRIQPSQVISSIQIDAEA
jgi:hypothetical protein